MKTRLLHFFFIVLLSGCSLLKEPEPDYTTAMVGAYTQIMSEYDANAKKWLNNTVTINITKKGTNTLGLLIASDTQYWNATRKTIETVYSNATLEKVKATDAKTIAIDETANYFTSSISKPALTTYKGQGSFNGESLAISLVFQVGDDAGTLNLKMVKDR